MRWSLKGKCDVTGGPRQVGIPDKGTPGVCVHSGGLGSAACSTVAVTDLQSLTAHRPWRPEEHHWEHRTDTMGDPSCRTQALELRECQNHPGGLFKIPVPGSIPPRFQQRRLEPRSLHLNRRLRWCCSRLAPWKVPEGTACTDRVNQVCRGHPKPVAQTTLAFWSWRLKTSPPLSGC